MPLRSVSASKTMRWLHVVCNNMPEFLRIFRKNKYEWYFHSCSYIILFLRICWGGDHQDYTVKWGSGISELSGGMCPNELPNTDSEHWREKVGKFVSVTLDGKEIRFIIKRIQTKFYFLSEGKCFPWNVLKDLFLEMPEKQWKISTL